MKTQFFTTIAIILLLSNAATAAPMCSDLFARQQIHLENPSDEAVFGEKARYLEKLATIQETLFLEFIRKDLIVIRNLVKSDTDVYNHAQLKRLEYAQSASFAPGISKEFLAALNKLTITAPGQSTDSTVTRGIKDLVDKEPFFQWLKSMAPNANLTTEIYLAIKGRDPISAEAAILKVRANHDPALREETRRYILDTLVPRLQLLSKMDKLAFRLQFEDTISNFAWKYARSPDLLITKRKEIIDYVIAVAGGHMSRAQHEVYERLFTPPADRSRRADGEYLKAYYLAKEGLGEVLSPVQFEQLLARAEVILARPEYQGKVSLEDNFFELAKIYGKEPVSYEKALALRFLDSAEAQKMIQTLDSLNALIELYYGLKDLNSLSHYIAN